MEHCLKEFTWHFV